MEKLRENIYNVGAEGNNAYLITGEKNVLIDTVSRELSQRYIENIHSVIADRKIDYLVLNHTEPDKSGAVCGILAIYPDITVVSSTAGLRNMKEMTGRDFNEKLAKDRGTLNIGDDTLEFFITPHLNWPDSMVTFWEKEGILFSCDLFSSDDGDDHISALSRYFSRVLAPHNEYVASALSVLPKNISMICAGRGGILRGKEQIDAAMGFYEKASHPSSAAVKKAAVIYSSVYGATEQMARVICDTLQGEGITVQMVNVRTDEVTDDFDAIAAGTPTVDRKTAEGIIEAVSSLDVIKNHGKPFFVFGSHGWSGEGAQTLHSLMLNMRFRPFSKPFTSIFNMTKQKRDELRRHTKGFAQTIKDGINLS